MCSAVVDAAYLKMAKLGRPIHQATSKYANMFLIKQVIICVILFCFPAGLFAFPVYYVCKRKKKQQHTRGSGRWIWPLTSHHACTALKDDSQVSAGTDRPARHTRRLLKQTTLADFVICVNKWGNRGRCSSRIIRCSLFILLGTALENGKLYGDVETEGNKIQRRLLKLKFETVAASKDALHLDQVYKLNLTCQIKHILLLVANTCHRLFFESLSQL